MEPDVAAMQKGQQVTISFETWMYLKDCEVIAQFLIWDDSDVLLMIENEQPAFIYETAKRIASARAAHRVD